MDVGAGASTAALPGVEEEGKVGHLNGIVQVGVVEDNVGGFACSAIVP